MIASAIGRIFLTAYNEKYKRNYTAKEFFVEVYFPLFFDHEKYMQWVTNSPFVQGIKKGCPPSKEGRQERLKTFLEKVESQDADASIAIGYPSLDILATTSGQLTTMNLPLEEEDVFLSWIGSALGIGVQGGFSILFDDPELLLHLFEGWQLYRENLNTQVSLRGNQINTWNGQWIAHRYERRLYREDDPVADFHPFQATKEGMEVKICSWTEVLFAVSRHFDRGQLVGYVYNLGQTNSTVGFIPFVLVPFRRMSELYEKLFGELMPQRAETLFGTAFGFARACQRGVIGLEALQPKEIKEYMDKGKVPRYKADGAEEDKISFNIYQTWLVAMLNNDDLFSTARDVAEELCRYMAGAAKGRTDRRNKVENLLGAVNKKAFIESLVPLIKDVSDALPFEELGKRVHYLPADNVPYFLTLVRFQYAIVSKNNNNE